MTQQQLVDIQKKYRTNSGRSVKFYERIAGQEYPILGAMLTERGEWLSTDWTDRGAYQVGLVGDYDLVEIKEEVRYISFYQDIPNRLFAGDFGENPPSVTPNNVVGTAKLTFEDGKLVSAEVITNANAE